jgi:hypothetical protein
MARPPAKSAAAPPSAQNEWIEKIHRWQEAHQMAKWRASADKIRDLYRYENSVGAKTRKYQMLWSNMETMKGATYAKPPKAEVMRRFRDKDDTARQAGMMVERCINYTLDAENYDEIFRKVRDDFLLEARGQARVLYEPVMEVVERDDDGLDVAAVQGPDAAAADEYADAREDSDDGQADEVLTFERVPLKYIHPADFVTDPARTWEEVNVCGFRSYLCRDDLVERFGEEIGNQITLDAKADTKEGREQPGDEFEPKATIWELWHKDENRVRWVAVGYPDVLEESEPYLKFKEFFPCPRPAYGTLTNDTLAPRPDYVFYQDQAEEINLLTARIASLQESLKIVGFYPGGPKGEGTPEVERAVTPGVENKMIAVQGWDNFTTKGSGKVPVVFLPVTEVAAVLKGCVELRQQLIEDVNQIYGLTDIMRGAGNVNETATAQGIKAQFGSLRIRTRQAELARFCRDIIRLAGEVICNHFQPETLMSMSNMPLPTDASVAQAAMLQQQAQLMQQAAQQHAAAMQQQQAATMAHNGPPMGGPPAPPPGALQ